MKASTPSLILFFVTSFLVIVFKLAEIDTLVLLFKSIVIPSLFIYYLVSNNYKLSRFASVLFMLFFIRDSLTTLNISESALGSFLCVLVVYHLLAYLALKDFSLLRFKWKDSLFISVLVLGITTICYSVLNLQLENLELNFYLYVYFGVVLSFLSVISIVNYIKKNTYMFFIAMVMCVCFIITDIFFVLYKFYFYNYVVTLISIVTQFLSYFFMVKYLLEKENTTADLELNNN